MPEMIRCSIWGYLTRRRRMRQQATELLERVGLIDRIHHRPRELSGGEMQRAAIARALMSKPRLLLADEPTGNLDEERGHEIVALLRDLNRTEGLTIIMVTHNMDLVAPTDRVVRLVKGRVEGAACSDVVLPLQPAGMDRQCSSAELLDSPRRKAL
jgi:lipoprotein-releasing system ATP-binding protein